MSAHILIKSSGEYYYAVKKSDIRRVSDTVNKDGCG
jgi:hypothetical protein